MSAYDNNILNMVFQFLTDNEIMTEKKRGQIIKALERNASFTTTWSLNGIDVEDIYGHDSKTSGFYITLTGCQTAVSFFVNNDLEIVRKPSKNKVKVAYRYSYYNVNMFDEAFWSKYF